MRRLVWVGAPLTGVLAAVAAHFIIGMPWPIAAMLGAILIVSGPTVINPILNVARPAGRVRGILLWEGTILDPIGALVAVVVFLVDVVGRAYYPAGQLQREDAVVMSLNLVARRTTEAP